MKKLLFLLLCLPLLGTAQTVISNNLSVSAPKALDARTGKFSGGAWIPFATTTEANTAIPSSRRYVGLTVCIGTSTTCTEYWYSGGIADGNLVLKFVDGGGGGSYPTFAAPSGFGVTGSGTGTVALTAPGTTAEYFQGNGTRDSKSNLPVSTAQATAIAAAQAAAVQRANHTGVQAATTITQDATHRFATDAEKATWNAGTGGGSSSISTSGEIDGWETITDNDNGMAAKGWIRAYVKHYVDSTAAAEGWAAGGGGGDTTGGGDTSGSVSGSYNGIPNCIVDLYAGGYHVDTGAGYVTKWANAAIPGDTARVSGQTGEAPPVFVAASGGTPGYIHFSGSQMIKLDTMRVPTGTDALTVFVVGKPTANTGNLMQYGTFLGAGTFVMQTGYPTSSDLYAAVWGSTGAAGEVRPLTVSDSLGLTISSATMDLTASAGSQINWLYNGNTLWGTSGTLTSTDDGTPAATPGTFLANGPLAIGTRSGAGFGFGVTYDVNHILIFKGKLNSTQITTVINGIKAETGAFTAAY